MTNALNTEDYGSKSIESPSIFNTHYNNQSKLENHDECRAESKMLAKTSPSILTSQAKTVVLHQSQAKSNGTIASSSSSRPAWALTESAAETADEERLQDDEDDLLSFAEGLDFDQYIGDMEVRTMMDGLRHRIAEMEKEVAMEEKRDGAIEERAVKREQLAMMVRYYEFSNVNLLNRIE